MKLKLKHLEIYDSMLRYFFYDAREMKRIDLPGFHFIQINIKIIQVICLAFEVRNFQDVNKYF